MLGVRFLPGAMASRGSVWTGCVTHLSPTNATPPSRTGAELLCQQPGARVGRGDVLLNFRCEGPPDACARLAATVVEAGRGGVG